MALTRYIEIKVDSAKAKSNVDSLDKSMVGLGQDADKASSSMSALSKAAAAVAAALSVSKVIAYADAWTVVSNKLSNSVKAHEDLADVTTRVFDVAQKTRSSIEATADLYAKLERSTKSLGLSTADLEEIVTTINQAFVVSGSSPEEAARAITQLGQAFDSGALFAEEFNSINDSGNRLVRALSESLGLNVKQLKDLGSQGKLTNEVLISAFRQQASVIEDEYQKTIETFSQSTIVATQNLTKFIGESVLVQSSVAAFGDTMILASENIETLIDIATSLAVIYAARLAPAVIASVTSITALIAAQTKATVTTNALGQRTVVATGYMNAFAVASRGASTALALIGGPAGLLILTVYGMTELLKASRDTTTQMDLFAEKTEEAEKSLKGLTVAQANFKLSSIEGELIVAAAKMADLQKQADDTFNALTQKIATGSESGLVILEQQANNAQAALKETSDRIVDLAAQASALRGSALSPLVVSDTSTPAAPTLPSTQAKTEKLKEPELADSGYSERYLQAQVNQTQVTAQELQNRLALFNDYTTQINKLDDDSFAKAKLLIEANTFEQSNAAAINYTNKVAELEAEKALILENDRLTAEARTELQIQLDEQKILAAQEYELLLTEIAEDGANSRNAITRSEWEAASSIVSSLGTSMVSAFSGQSRKMFEIGKALAISDTIINTYSSATKAYDAMASIPYIGPALGAAAAAAAIAGGLANVKRIQSQSFGGGSSAASSTYSNSGSSGTASASSASAASAPTQTTVFDFRSREGQFFTAQDVVDILSSVEGAVVINNSLGNASRVGEI